MQEAIHISRNGLSIYKLDEVHVCTLMETEPGSWEIVSTAGTRRIGSYAKAKKLSDDFLLLLVKSCRDGSGEKLTQQILNKRFTEFLDYRMVG